MPLTYKRQGISSISLLPRDHPDNIRKVLSQNKKPDIFLHLGWGDVYDPHHKSHINENLSEGKNLFDTLYKHYLADNSTFSINISHEMRIAVSEVYEKATSIC